MPNVLNIAKDSLNAHKELKKVIILDHPPRFDSHLKSEMASIANTTIKEMIEGIKNELNIELGKHSLDCHGIGRTFDSRYRNSILKKMNGLHFYGPCGSKDYSESLVNILVNSLRNTAPDNSSLDKSVIPLSNRFDVLSQGNC